MFLNNAEATEFILSKVNVITDNAALIKYIENGIKKNDGVLITNVVKDNKCDFEFKNQNGDCFRVNIKGNMIFVNTSSSNLREKVEYDKNQDGTNIKFYGNYRIFSDCGLVILKNIEEESFYDGNKKFVSSNTHMEQNTCLNGSIMRKFMGTNYDLDIKQCVVGDEIVKIEDIKYHYIPEMDSKKCFVSEYRNGMYCSVNEDVYDKPLYFEVLGDFSNYEYKIKSIEKKNAQKQKSML